MSKPTLDDYIDVAERIQDFKAVFPEGSLQTIDYEVLDVDGKHFVVYCAAAYRTPDDPRPGHGVAWEPVPGPTSFTKNSELQNAETSAWGRAIVALGFVTNRKVASRQEVRNRQAEADAIIATSQKAAQSVSGALPDELVERLRSLYSNSGWDEDKLRWKLIELGADDVSELGAAIRSLPLEKALALEAALEDQTVENVAKAFDATEGE